MDPLPAELSLEQFVLEMGRVPVGTLAHKRFLELTGRLRVSDDLIESCARFSDVEYTRNLVLRTSAFELLVLCWQPGQESTIHDHAGSLNSIRVYSGELTSRIFAPADGVTAGAGPVVQTQEDRLLPSEAVIGVDRSGIHQLADTASEPLVTVHVYAPPLKDLVVYHTASDVVERRPLRYTLHEDL
jgi:cysteine dioxygenase